ncbi:MAG: carboxypeptidase-like regulatory domain-containing protein [Bacteroidales bacterium]
MKSFYFLFIFNILILSNTIGQCIVRGKVTDVNGEILIGVVVYPKSDMSSGAVTDVNGDYSVKVNSSQTQVLLLKYIGYKTIEDTIKCNGGVLMANYVLESASQALNTVTISAKAGKSNDRQMEAIKKLSSNTIDFISSETIKKIGDANVAAAVSRITGVSTNSGGIITVRGIGDRYVKTTINGSRIPTLDPFTNNIKLDMFPSALIDNVVISKTARPDLPGDWAGAYLSVETKSYPDALSVDIETSFGYNSQTTSKEVITSQRSNTDWLGYDKGFRDINHGEFVNFIKEPSDYQELAALGLGDYYKSIGVTSTTPWNNTYFKLGLVELGLLGKAQFDDAVAIQSAMIQYNTLAYKGQAYNLVNARAVNSAHLLPNNWNTTTRKAPLNFSQSFSIGNQTKLFGRTLGYLVGFRYSSFVQYDPNSTANKITLESKIIDGQVAIYDSSFQKVSKETNGWSGLMNLAYKLNSNHSVSFLFMPNVTGVNNVRDSHYFSPAEYGIFEDNKKLQFYESRKQMIYQLNSDHYLPGSKIKIDFNASFTNGQSDAPDLKIISYRPESLSVRPNEPQFLATSVGTGRYFRYLFDKIFDSHLSAEFPLNKKTDLVRKIKIGGSYLYNSMKSDQYFYQLWQGNLSEYIQNASPDADPYGLDRFDIVTVVNPSSNLPERSVQEYYRRDSYPTDHLLGTNDIIAGFAMADYSLNSIFRVTGGLRIEKSTMHTDCLLYDSLALDANDPRRSYEGALGVGPVTIKPGELNSISYLPSANLIYKLRNDESSPISLRLNFSQTVARPNFRELSDNAAYDYELNSIVRGNSGLRMVQINNLDMRLESYFRSGDNILLSVFYKDFKNHIEIVNFGGTTGFVWINNPNYTWLAGIELEGKKNITKSLEFRANLTIVNSHSSFEQLFVSSTGYIIKGIGVVSHTMLGQAPYVLNGMLNYTLKKQRLTTSLNYNVQGTRLVIIGTGSLPDIYELPRNVMDIKIAKQIGKHFNASLKVLDILSTSIVRTYQVDKKNILDYDRYKYGRNYVFAISYKL